MKLVYPERGIEILFPENYVQVLVIERPDILSEVIESLRESIDSDTGLWTLSDKEILHIDKMAELIIDPWNIDINCKRIKSRLFHYLDNVSSEMCCENFLKGKAAVFQYMESVLEVSSYSISYREEITNQDIFKLLDVHIELDGQSLLEKIVNYISLLSSLCGVRLVIFFSLHNILMQNELILLYQEAANRKISLLLVEARQNPVQEVEKCIIIDKDSCVITI